MEFFMKKSFKPGNRKEKYKTKTRANKNNIPDIMVSLNKYTFNKNIINIYLLNFQDMFEDMDIGI